MSLGALVQTGRWDWEYYPYPYNSQFQGKASAQPAPRLPIAAGLGDCGCGCKGHGDCGDKSGGLGFFDSGFDFGSWGWMEWGAIAAGVYFVASVIGDTKRGVARTKRVATTGKTRARRIGRAAKTGFLTGYQAAREAA